MKTKIVLTGPLAGKNKRAKCGGLTFDFLGGECDVSHLSDEDQVKVAHYMQVRYQSRCVRELDAGETYAERLKPEVVYADADARFPVAGQGKPADGPAPAPAAAGSPVTAGTGQPANAGGGNAGNGPRPTARH